MQLFELLNVEPTELKVHLAAWNGKNDPINLYFDGTFKSWQEHQNKRNFQRKYILSLIRLNKDDQWLFAGIYASQGIDKFEEGYHQYKTELTDVGRSLIGRLVVNYRRKGRNSYPKGESLVSDAWVHEVKPEPMAFSEFSNFKEVLLSRKQLELLYQHEYPSWKSALSSVSGVYLISDSNTGKLYVGSAYGNSGLWARWSDYFNTYHGGNLGLKNLYKENGKEAFESFNYSILEICDADLPAESVIAIESRWKQKLLAREFGYNEN